MHIASPKTNDELEYLRARLAAQLPARPGGHWHVFIYLAAGAGLLALSSCSSSPQGIAREDAVIMTLSNAVDDLKQVGPVRALPLTASSSRCSDSARRVWPSGAAISTAASASWFATPTAASPLPGLPRPPPPTWPPASPPRSRPARDSPRSADIPVGSAGPERGCPQPQQPRRRQAPKVFRGRPPCGGAAAEDGPRSGYPSSEPVTPRRAGQAGGQIRNPKTENRSIRRSGSAAARRQKPRFGLRPSGFRPSGRQGAPTFVSAPSGRQGRAPGACASPESAPRSLDILQ